MRMKILIVLAVFVVGIIAVGWLKSRDSRVKHTLVISAR